MKPYADALAAARRDLAEAFALRRPLEDSIAGTDRPRREATRRILTLSERALTGLEAHEREFRALAPRRRRRRSGSPAPARCWASWRPAPPSAPAR